MSEEPEIPTINAKTGETVTFEDEVTKTRYTGIVREAHAESQTLLVCETETRGLVRIPISSLVKPKETA